MYTDNRTVQILVAMLKKIGANRIVISPGTRNVPLSHTVENDNFFKCYSVVDERSAGYFGIGLALRRLGPVVLSCTSGTAAANYTSAAWEAKYQSLPLIIITSDRNEYFLGQNEEQMIDQNDLYGQACRHAVSLPIVRNDLDAWCCNRLINEAFLEMVRGSGGPVHINVPTDYGLFPQNFTTQRLPKVQHIEKFRLSCMSRHAERLTKTLAKSKIMILSGQKNVAEDEIGRELDIFSENYNAISVAENISNLQLARLVSTDLISRALNNDQFEQLLPDVVITTGGQYVSQIRGKLKNCKKNIVHWDINKDGKIVDQFQQLKFVFECSTLDFFKFFNSMNYQKLKNKNDTYYRSWQTFLEKIPEPDFEYSSGTIIQKLSQAVPENSIVHFGNGVAVHVSQYFKWKKGIYFYCNSGTTTIDGSVSTAVGHANTTDKLVFLVVGDLSFFYDMNGIWNRHIPKNLRILMYNNCGGQTFHWNAARGIQGIEKHISAEHTTTAKPWAKERKFKYLSASDNAKLERQMKIFVSEIGEQPVLLEAFTDKSRDADILHQYYDECRRRF